MIVNDHKSASLTSTALAFGLFFASCGVAAAGSEALAQAAPADAAAAPTATSANGSSGSEPASGSQASDRPAVPLTIFVGRDKRVVRSSAATVGALLGEQHIALAARDEVYPALVTPPAANEVVRVVHVDSWTARLVARILPRTHEHLDRRLAEGVTRTLDAGRPGEREVTVQYVKRGDDAPTRTVLASRIVRAPRVKIVARGIAAYDSLARIAQAGFSGALHFAGSALHMLASAYSPGCYGCSGTTASGVRAGFGVIAVDPGVIPLGSRLYIPGYGRAIAGDTGGAIAGHRIDLGFNSDGAARGWGLRNVVVYVLR